MAFNSDEFFNLDYTHFELEELLDKINEGFVLTEDEYIKLLRVLKLDDMSFFSGDYNDLKNKPNLAQEISDMISALKLESSTTVNNKLQSLQNSMENYTEQMMHSKSDVGHKHTAFDIDGLQGQLNSKADIMHNHSDKYPTFDYLDSKIKNSEITSGIEELREELKSKASYVHNHDDVYPTFDFMDVLESRIDELENNTDIEEVKTQLRTKADADHNHDTEYPTHSYLDSKIHELQVNSGVDLSPFVTKDSMSDYLDDKADAEHNHDNIYPTFSHLDSKIKEVSEHNHNDLHPTFEHLESTIKELENELDRELSLYITREIMEAYLEDKADFEHSHDSLYPTFNYLESKIKELEVNSGIDLSPYITKESINEYLNKKADIIHHHNDDYPTFSYLDSKIHELQVNSGVDLSPYATKDLMEEYMSRKANKAHVHELEDIESIQTILDEKANVADVFNKNEISEIINNHRHASYLTKEEAESNYLTIDDFLDNAEDFATNIALQSKADIVHLHDDVYYSKKEVDDKLVDLSVGTAIDLSAYAKQSEVDIALLSKADIVHPHDISNINNLREELNEKVSRSSINDLLKDKANKEHIHEEYTSIDLVNSLLDIQRQIIEEEMSFELQDYVTEDNFEAELLLKSNKDHRHDEDYSPTGHAHDISTIEGLQNELDSKANLASLENYVTIEDLQSKADTVHEHNDLYYGKAEIDEKIEQSISSVDLSEYAKIVDVNIGLATKAESIHKHDISDINDLQNELDNKANKNETATKKELEEGLSGKSDASHKHDDDYAGLEHSHNVGEINNINDHYYDKATVNDFLGQKSDTNHNHNDVYYTKNEVEEKIENGLGAIDLSTYATTAYVDDELAKKSDIGHIHDISEITGLGEELESKIDKDEAATKKELEDGLSSKSDASHKHDDDYAALEHNHTIEEITDLKDNYFDKSEIEDLLSEKSDTGHNHNDIYYTKDEVEEKIQDGLDSIDLEPYATIEYVDEELAKKSNEGHGHDISNIDGLQDMLDSKANAEDVYTKLEMDDAIKDINTKIDTKSDSNHNHDEVYSKLNHDHTVIEITDLYDNVYSEAEVDDLLSGKSDSDHNHDDDYAPKKHEHEMEDFSDLLDNVYTEDEVDDLLSGKSDSDHTHDENYAALKHEHTANEITDLYDDIYNKDEIDTALASKAEQKHEHAISEIKNLQDELDSKINEDIAATKEELKEGLLSKSDISHKHDDYHALKIHEHDDLYYTENEINELLNTTKNNARIEAVAEAQEFTTQKIAELIDSAPDAMNTLNELANAINEHQTVYDAYVETISKALAGKSDSDHNHHSIYYTKDEINEKVSGDLNTTLVEYAKTADVNKALAEKSDVGHAHECSNITDLQDALDLKADLSITATKKELSDLSEIVAGKSDSDHNHNTVYYTKDEVNEKVSGDLGTTLVEYAKTADVNESLAKKSDVGHTHKCIDITDLQDTLDLKADLSIVATKEQHNALSEIVAGKSDSGHNHNTIYYTKDEIDQNITNKINAIDHSSFALKTDLASKADSDHIHDISEIEELGDKIESKIDKIDAATKTELRDGLSSKSDSTHKHENLYLTRDEINDLIDGVIVNADLKKYATIDYVDDGLATKAEEGHRHDITIINGLEDALNSKMNLSIGATKEDLAKKSDEGHGHDISEINELKDELDSKALAADVFTKDDVTSKLAAKSDTTHNHMGVYAEYDHAHDMFSISGLVSTYYTKAAVDNLLFEKADADHTHEMGEIKNLEATLDNMYTKEAVNTALGLKLNKADVSIITTAQIDDAFDDIFE